MTDHRTRARALAEEALRRGDAVGWFETLYREAQGDWTRIPWADLAPNPHVAAWLDERRFEDFLDDETPRVRRFRVIYQRPRGRTA